MTLDNGSVCADMGLSDDRKETSPCEGGVEDTEMWDPSIEASISLCKCLHFSLMSFLYINHIVL